MTSPVDVAQRYLDAFADGDADVIAALVAQDFVNEHLSELGSGCVGRSEYRSRLPGFLASFVDIRYVVENIGVLDVRPHECSEVVARYRLQAEFDGTAIDIPGIMWFEVRDELIARRTDLWDSLTFLRQTGHTDATG